MGSPERSKNTWKTMLFRMKGAKTASPSGTKKFVTSSTPLTSRVAPISGIMYPVCKSAPANAFAPSGIGVSGCGMKLKNIFNPKTVSGRPRSTRAIAGSHRVKDFLAGRVPGCMGGSYGLFIFGCGLRFGDKFDEAVEAFAPSLVESHLLVFFPVFERPVQRARRV